MSGKNSSMMGKTVLITGGGKGIGRETARVFGQSGCKLVISGRSLGALEATAGELRATGHQVLPIQADVTKSEDCRRVVEEAVREFGRLDVLINNAGMSMRGNFEETSLELFDKVVDINFTGAVHMTSYALPHLMESGGSVIFISSVSALKGLPGIAPYGAAKMALTGFAESLYAEVYRHVHVGIVYVSFTENDPGKQMYTADGSLAALQRDRNSSTQEGVARTVLRMAVKRRMRVLMTPLGKAAGLIFALFPRFSSFLISRLAARSAMYGRRAK